MRLFVKCILLVVAGLVATALCSVLIPLPSVSAIIAYVTGFAVGNTINCWLFDYILTRNNADKNRV